MRIHASEGALRARASSTASRMTTESSSPDSTVVTDEVTEAERDRQSATVAPNAAWVTDVTYVATDEAGCIRPCSWISIRGA